MANPIKFDDDKASQKQFENARKQLLAGKPAEARALLEPLAAKFPDEGTVMIALATVYLAQGDAQRTLGLVEPRLKTTPNWPNARRLQANALRELGQWQHALEAARQWSERDPESLAVQASALEALGRAAEAKPLLAKALKADSDLLETDWVAALSNKLGPVEKLPLPAALEQAYGVTLPERYARFLADGDYAKHPKVVFSGFYRGEYALDFTSELLTDVVELGQNAGITDMDDVPWSTDYAGYLPIAVLSHPDVVEPKIFLVLEAKGAGPVLLFAQEGWELFPLADSFEAFLAGLPAVTTGRPFTPGEADD